MKAWIGALALGIGVALFVAGAVMLGIGISKDKSSSHDCSRSTKPPATRTAPSAAPSYESEEISALIQEKIDVDRIRENLRNFTVDPHQAGTDANNKVADSIMARWRAAGLESESMRFSKK
ncbi:hypothetical protein COOONC_17292 [Cooperia oncophora]